MVAVAFGSARPQCGS